MPDVPLTPDNADAWIEAADTFNCNVVLVHTLGGIFRNPYDGSSALLAVCVQPIVGRRVAGHGEVADEKIREQLATFVQAVAEYARSRRTNR